MKRRSSGHHKEGGGEGGWLITYSDLMNNLLIFFILLYCMSSIDLQKFQSLMNSFSTTFNGTPTSSYTGIGSDPNLSGIWDGSSSDSSSGGSSDESSSDSSSGSGMLDDLDGFVSKITTIIKDKGYQDQVIVERVDSYVYFRFAEGCLFYPNQSVLKEGSYAPLAFIGEVLNEAYGEISAIEIAGHTAYVPNDELVTDFSSWELSSARSLTVLKFLVAKCNLPKNKMVILGYSSTKPYTEGETEAEKALNRRVDIRISRVKDDGKNDN